MSIDTPTGPESEMHNETDVMSDMTLTADADAPLPGEASPEALMVDETDESAQAAADAKKSADKKKKTQVMVMGGALVLALGAVAAFYALGGMNLITGASDDQAAMPQPTPPAATVPAPVMTPTPTATAPTPTTSAPAAPAPTPPVPTQVAAAAPVVPAVPVGLQPPTPPTVGVPIQYATDKVSDPFSGGPPLPIPVIVPPPPPPDGEVTIAAMPWVLAASVRETGGQERGPEVMPRTPPAGRHAGWIYNDANGQIVAIFEDRNGQAHTVRVGDKVGDYRVKSIAPELLVLVDRDGKVEKLKLQGLDSFITGAAGAPVTATPATAMPPMPFGGQR